MNEKMTQATIEQKTKVYFNAKPRMSGETHNYEKQLKEGALIDLPATVLDCYIRPRDRNYGGLVGEFVVRCDDDIIITADVFGSRIKGVVRLDLADLADFLWDLQTGAVSDLTKAVKGRKVIAYLNKETIVGISAVSEGK